MKEQPTTSRDAARRWYYYEHKLDRGRPKSFTVRALLRRKADEYEKLTMELFRKEREDV